MEQELKQPTPLTPQRRPYTKPQLEEVSLVVGETVMQACKAGGNGGPNGIHNCAQFGKCYDNHS